MKKFVLFQHKWVLSKQILRKEKLPHERRKVQKNPLKQKKVESGEEGGEELGEKEDASEKELDEEGDKSLNSILYIYL